MPSLGVPCLDVKVHTAAAWLPGRYDVGGLDPEAAKRSAMRDVTDLMCR